MDFRDIKNTWKDSFKDETHLVKDEIEARLRIKKVSNTALNKVKRNYKVELILGVLLSILFVVWMMISLSNNYKFILVAFTIIFFGILVLFTWRNYQKVRETVLSSEQLKPALIKTIRDIENYVNFNKSKFTKFLLLPFAIVFGMLIGFFNGIGENEIFEVFLILESNYIKIIILLVVMSALFIPISQVLNNKMYKQHLDELKQCLKEFEDIEE